MKKKIDVTKEQKGMVIALLLGFLALVWMVPFISTGVVNNDGLMSHLNTAYKPLLYERDVEQGRIIKYYLSYPINFIMNYSENFYVARIRDYCFIILSMLSLAVLYYKFFHRYLFSCLTVCLGLAMLPITFEHTLPQAYCGFAFYFAILIGTVLLFMRWIETGKRCFLVVSLMVNFYILFFYEAYIMLMPLYVVAAWHILPEGKKRLKDIFHVVKYHIVMAALYLMIYFGMRYFFTSTYEGNSVGSLSLVSIGKVLKQLILASMPGYYWTNAKYRYIFRVYSNYEAISEWGEERLLRTI